MPGSASVNQQLAPGIRQTIRKSVEHIGGGRDDFGALFLRPCFDRVDNSRKRFDDLRSNVSDHGADRFKHAGKSVFVEAVLQRIDCCDRSREQGAREKLACRFKYAAKKSCPVIFECGEHAGSRFRRFFHGVVKKPALFCDLLKHLCDKVCRNCAVFAHLDKHFRAFRCIIAEFFYLALCVLHQLVEVFRGLLAGHDGLEIGHARAGGLRDGLQRIEALIDKLIQILTGELAGSADLTERAGKAGEFLAVAHGDIAEHLHDAHNLVGFDAEGQQRLRRSGEMLHGKRRFCRHLFKRADHLAGGFAASAEKRLEINGVIFHGAVIIKTFACKVLDHAAGSFYCICHQVTKGNRAGRNLIDDCSGKGFTGFRRIADALFKSVILQAKLGIKAK